MRFWWCWWCWVPGGADVLASSDEWRMTSALLVVTSKRSIGCGDECFSVGVEVIYGVM